MSLSGNWKPFRESHTQLAEAAYASFASEMRLPHLSYCVALSDHTALNICESFRFNRTTFQRTAALRILRPPEETSLKELRLTEDTQVDAVLGGFDVARKGNGEIALEKLCRAVTAPEVRSARSISLHVSVSVLMVVDLRCDGQV